MTADPYSTDAAATIDKAAMRTRLLALIAETGDRGVTSDELEIRSGMSHQTVSARLTEMKKRDEVRAAGRRPTRSGRTAGVWVAVPVQQTLWQAS